MTRGARRSLDSIGASRLEVAERLTTPRWYYPALALLVAQMVVVHGLLGNLPAASSVLVVVLGTGWLVRSYTGHTGIVARWPDGVRSGVALAALTLGMVVPVLCVAFAGEVAVGVVMAWAAYTVGSTVVLGPAYDAAYRADLRRRHVGGAA